MLLLIHVLNGVSYFLREGHHPFILFHACLDPFSIHSIPLDKVLALDTVLLTSYNLIIIVGNLHLYRQENFSFLILNSFPSKYPGS